MPLFKLPTPLTFNDFCYNRRFQNEIGIMVVAGDEGIVYADRAYMKGGNEIHAIIEVRDVAVLTTDTRALRLAEDNEMAKLNDYLGRMAYNIVVKSYLHVQDLDVWRPQRDARWPDPPSGIVKV